ncbi:MAG: hypothetical protein IKT72_05195 [Clostridia bacterium]|nr:hypothetical protein [Clostridia bacterium]
MKIDPELIRELVALSDDALWRRIHEMAKTHGIALPEATPPPETLAKLRAAVRGNGTLKIAEAASVIGRYVKEHGGKGHGL